MEDRDFFDHIYQIWSKTTGAQDRYWMPEAYPDTSGRHRIWAMGQDETRKLVAKGLNSLDADFITAVHGCFADLVRRLHSALDEAERLDYAADEREGLIAELTQKVDDLETTMRKMDQDLIKANADLVYWQDIAQNIQEQR